MRVAALQLDYPAGEARADRLARVTSAMEARPAADLVVLPELWDVGYFDFDAYADAAGPLDDGRLSALPAGGAVVVAGSVLERDGGALHNTTVVLDGAGAILGRYRKRRLFSHRSREAELLRPGTEAVVVDTAVGRLGLNTCFDLRFPEQFAELRAQGADVMVVPAAWPAARREHWRVLVTARAIETQTPVIAVNGTGDCFGVELAGSTMIVDARGEVLADGGSTAGWVEAEVDAGDTAAWRAEFPLTSAVTVG